MGNLGAQQDVRAERGVGPAVCDMHVHTHHSCDSAATLEEYCLRAVSGGVACVCFTDHVDWNPADTGYGYYRPQAFFDEFRRAQDKYAGAVRLLAGVEFAEPQAYPREFEELLRLPYDFVIGSIHYWYGDLFVSEMVKQGVSIETCSEAYWRKVRGAAAFGGFDSLGHIDFPKRYYGKMLYDDGLIGEAFAAMVKNGVCLEINTSSLRKGLDETMPGRVLLKRYADAGGTRVTIGADSHSPDDLAAGFGEAAQLAAEYGLSVVAFSKRVPFALY